MNTKKEKYAVTIFKGNEETKKFRSIAKIHKKMITTGFLSSFSIFILSHLYRSMAKSSKSDLIVASGEDGDILGFMGISYSTSAFYKSFLLGKGLLLSPLLIPRIVSMTFLKKLFETLLYPFKNKQASSEISHIDSEILNFCVDDSAQRMGIGKELFKMAEKKFQMNDVITIKIVTGSEQKSAHRFYENLGAELVTVIEIHKNIQSFIYNYSIQ